MNITKEQLEDLYIQQGLTVRQCADFFGLPSHGSIQRAMKRFGIEARPAKFQKGNQINKGRNPETHGGWKGGKQVVRCDGCGRKLFRFPCQIHEKNFCNQSCYGEWRSKNFKGENNPNYGNIVMFGEANPNWKGGITLEEYCDAWKDRDFKYDIKERDNHECQNPDCRKNSNKLSVHHIDYNKGNCGPRNLITLCVSCNARANFNREFWKAGYQAMIKTKYQLEELKIAI